MLSDLEAFLFQEGCQHVVRAAMTMDNRISVLRIFGISVARTALRISTLDDLGTQGKTLNPKRSRKKKTGSI